MEARERRALERQEREQRIVDAARALAEAEGWSAVTTRRLADEIGRSQPVLYGHFPDGKVGIVRAVALQGFRDMADVVDTVRAKAGEGEQAKAVVTAYLDFAKRRPAVYEAMFMMPLGLAFGEKSAPPELQSGFASLRDGLSSAHVDGVDAETLTEVAWSAMHGIAMLTRDGRLRPRARTARIAALVGLLTPG
ncbi:TetR/AcrR family transcriptional regulator [Luteipulveratus mongoliensis]|uniref:TetR family transcriptional regulator n=1 Tax=Luteipulveratus mongoliensis TaxID=571913 RepID=A0A0K1JKE8_9MICO|nr:TetR/AcrR family transcriptional regulator [Luteipulveratus mongoliensis]AKU17192.1 hypothetical protein VV02_17220 [Luteipulveratus mongoliensis]